MSLPPTGDGTDLWAWVAQHGRDGTTVRTFIRETDADAVLRALHLQVGPPEVLSHEQAEVRRMEWAAEFNEPPYQVRLCPLGAWTLVLEDDTAMHLLRDPDPGGPWLRVDWSLGTQIGFHYQSGVPGELFSYYGTVVGEGRGLLHDVARDLGLLDPDTVDEGFPRLMAAMAQHLGIPSAPLATVLGPLPTYTGVME